MRLSKLTRDAIDILVACTRADGRQIKAADIATTTGLSLQNTLKISHILIKRGFLTAQRGRGGGLRLARDAGEINLGEVVREVETLAEGDDAMPLDGLIDDAMAAFLTVLDRHKLSDFAAQATKAGKGKHKPAAATAKPAPQRTRRAVSTTGRRAALT